MAAYFEDGDGVANHLTPDGIASNPNSWVLYYGAGTWDANLDTNDGNSSIAGEPSVGSVGNHIWVTVGNPTGYPGGYIEVQSIYITTEAGYSADYGNMGLYYSTDGRVTSKGNSVYNGDLYYTYITSGVYYEDSKGGALELADINNLQLKIARESSVATGLYVSQLVAVVQYTTTPTGTQFTLSTSVTGAGTVAAGSNSGAINCSTGDTGTCSDLYNVNKALTLNATPAAGYAFQSWSGGDCDGSTSTSCNITINSDESTTATFVLRPTATYTSGTYDSATNTLVLTGTNFDTIDTVGTDVKSYMDWTKFSWDVNGDDGTTANISVAEADVSSLTITDANTLTLVFTTTKADAIEATADAGISGGVDTLDITAGFSRTSGGTPATTDALADGAFTIDDNQFDVTKTADTADGSCTLADCSLREAITAANADASATPASPHIINIPAGTYTITLTGLDFNNATGDFDVKEDVRLIGAGAGSTTISGQAGGGDYVFQAANTTVNFESMTITNNGNNSNRTSGGCVYSNGGTLNFVNATVDSCVATNGGAVFVESGSGVISTTGSTFSNNVATNVGGAIRSWGMTVDSSTFTNNDSTSNGGAIFNSTAALTIQNSSVFKGNDATGGTGGGAIYAQTALTINDSTFGGNGGGEANTAISGGAVFIESGKTLAVNRSTFIANSSTNVGGAIRTYGGTISSSVFENNANSGSSGGGAIFTSSAGVLTVDNAAAGGTESRFSGNQATAGPGGAIRGDGTNGYNMIINDTTFENNSASGEGGAVAHTHSTQTPNITVDGSHFYNNSSGKWGGALFARGTTTITNSSFDTNSAGGRGGAATSWNGFSVKNSTFYNNTSNGSFEPTQEYGGAFFTNATATVNNVTFVDNVAADGGSAIYAGGSTAPSNSIFANSASSAVTFCNNINNGGGYNLFNNGGNCYASAGTGDVSGSDPSLSAMAFNGHAVTKTMAPQTGSPVLDVGNNATCETTDQRGTSRPINATCDMGAYEGSVSPPNTAPIGGYTADNIIPNAQVTQSSNGDGIITITFRAQDAETENVTLKTFEYSVDGGATWNPPTNGDASASLSTNWTDSDGLGTGYTSAVDWSGTVHSFTFDTDHADVTGMAGVNQADVQIRFTLNDGTADSAAPVTSESFQVNNTDTFYVGNTGTGVVTTNCWTSGNSTCTLPGALSLITTGGATIHVELAGTYAVKIGIDGDIAQPADANYNFTLVSDVGASAILAGDGTDAPVIDITDTAITSAMVIDGFTINNSLDGGTASRGISITSSAAPTLKNLTLKGNQLDLASDGGAIYINAATATIQDSTIGATADKNQADQGAGIYIYNPTAEVSISGTAFEDNYTDYQGGAVYIYYANNYGVTISNSSFTGNDSPDGGAIYINISSQTVTITNTDFTNNIATDDGGAVHGYWGAHVDITGGTWTGNTAASDGGAIYLDNSFGNGSTLTITGGSYTNNVATGGSGGAIYTNKLADIDISNATIDSNDAGQWGGGLHLGNPLASATVTISNTSIDTNTSNWGGAGINIVPDTAAFSLAISSGTTIDSNVVNDAAFASYHGAGIRLYGSYAVDFSMTGGSISNNINYADSGAGGALYTIGASNITIDGTTINGNSIEGYGGALSLSNTGTTTISNSYIQGNSSLRDGGGIRINNGTTATITNTLISGNRVYSGSAYGGGIKVESSGILNLYNSTVAGNRSDFSGGGIYSSGTETIRNSIIYGNDGSSSDDFSGTIDTESNSIIGIADPDPLFVDTQLATAGAATTAGDYRLCNAASDPAVGCASGPSPGIDGGYNTSAPADDIIGESRPQGSGYDMGAYEYPAGPVSNSAPIGGYTANNVIPTAQATQSSNGDGIITINFRAQDADTNNVTLKNFEYSVDGGSSWSAPTNGDTSGSLSTNWTDSDGVGTGYFSAIDWSGTVHSFTFDTDHADVSGMAGVDQSDVQIRFTLTDGIADSASPVTSESFQVDNLAPTATITSATYDAATDTMVITGTDFTTIATASTDIKSYVDWSKFVWDINGDDGATADVTFVVGDITSLTVTDATNLTLVFSSAKATALEATTGYGTTGGADTLDVTAGFSKDAAGNAATTDAVADGTLTISAPTISVTKLSSVVSDPISVSNPKRIPGAVIEYIVTVSNSGAASPDAGTVIVINSIDTTTEEFDYATGITFTDGSTSSALTMGTAAYSNDSGSTYTYAPSGSYDPNVTHIKVPTSGTFAFGGSPAPSFTLKYYTRVK